MLLPRGLTRTKGRDRPLEAGQAQFPDMVDKARPIAVRPAESPDEVERQGEREVEPGDPGAGLSEPGLERPEIARPDAIQRSKAIDEEPRPIEPGRDQR